MSNFKPMVGDLYLARYYYSSKKITWEPCELLDIDRSNADVMYRVKFLETGAVKNIKSTKTTYVGNKITEEPSLRVINDKWINAEEKRINDDLQVVSNKLTVLEKLKRRCL